MSRAKGAHEVYYSYCAPHRFPGFGKQRLVINYRQADLSDNPTFFISNRLLWQAPGITRIRRHRWPVEVYHEEGKPKDWISINCGISTASNAMSPWSPWCRGTAPLCPYCVQPNMTQTFTRNFNVNSR